MVEIELQNARSFGAGLKCHKNNESVCQIPIFFLCNYPMIFSISGALWSSGLTRYHCKDATPRIAGSKLPVSSSFFGNVPRANSSEEMRVVKEGVPPSSREERQERRRERRRFVSKVEWIKRKDKKVRRRRGTFSHQID